MKHPKQKQILNKKEVKMQNNLKDNYFRKANNLMERMLDEQPEEKTSTEETGTEETGEEEVTDDIPDEGEEKGQADQVIEFVPSDSEFGCWWRSFGTAEHGEADERFPFGAARVLVADFLRLVAEHVAPATVRRLGVITRPAVIRVRPLRASGAFHGCLVKGWTFAKW